ncbi:MAG TPA: magnesium/cobalt transporter CorA [Longimicrobiales bacterium]
MSRPAPGRFLYYHLDPRGQLRRGMSRKELAGMHRAGRGPLWVDIDSTRDDDWALLAELFHFHPLAIEDTRSPNCRVKVEEYEGYLFIVVRGIHFTEETPDPYDVDPHNLYLFVGESFLVSVHAGRFAAVDTVAGRLDGGADALARGVDHVAYTLVDALVDLYFPTLDRVDEFIEEIEHEIFDGNGEQMSRIFDLKRALVTLRRHLAPMREATSVLANRPTPYLRPETQVYFRDVHDHVVRQLDAVESYRELLTGALEAQLATISNRTNEVIKALSVIATVVLPPTLIASVYGMNFRWMPWLHDPNGFWIAMGGMALITGALLAYVWWKGWL